MRLMWNVAPAVVVALTVLQAVPPPAQPPRRLTMTPGERPLAGVRDGSGRQSERAQPALAFREDWKETPAATPVTQDHVANPDLILTLHGPGGSRMKKSHHDQPADDPYYIWSGDTTAPWAVTLRHRRGPVDLSGAARVRWRARQSGFHELRLIVQADSKQWLVADQSDDASADWREREFPIRDLTWRALDITRIVEGRAVERPDLSRVLAIGVTDLRAGGGTPASSRLDWIEVYGGVLSPSPSRSTAPITLAPALIAAATLVSPAQPAGWADRTGQPAGCRQ